MPSDPSVQNPQRRAEILKAIRQRNVPPEPRPDLSQGPWTEYDDKPATFCKWLELAGGRAVRLPNRQALAQALDEWPAYSQATHRVSRVPGVGQSTLDLAAITDPHDLSHLDFALVEAELGVAESGAVWLTDAQLGHRALPFIVQHLGVVLSARALVDTMNHAYARVHIEGPGFGMFLAGPSKTADIEQSLVIGAHGPRSHVVFLLDAD